MPNIKSAIKRVEVAERNRVRNRAWKSAVRTVRNEVTDSVKVADVKKAGEALKQAYETIDKAVSKGILHKNSAARKKSALAKQVFQLTAAPSAKTTAAKTAAKPAAKTAAKPAAAKATAAKSSAPTNTAKK